MAWNRQIELTVGADGTGLLISDLHIDFNVERSITFSENSSEFVIYNAKADTRNKILQKDNNLIFKAGYEDEGIGTLFIGNITESKSIQEGPDWKTTIQAAAIRSEKEPLENTTVSISFASKSLLNSIIDEIGTAMGLVVLGSENASVELPNGWTYVGSAKGALGYCNQVLKDNDAALYIDNNSIVIYRTDVISSRFSGLILSYDSGLKSVQEITETTDEKKRKEKRISFNSIMLPKIQPNGLIQIKNTKNDGTYLVEKIRFFGNNYGGEFDCEGEAIA